MARPDLTPGQAMRLAKTIADIYAEATAELVRVVGKRINEGVVEPKHDSTVAQLSELVKLRDEAQRVVVAAQAKGGREAVRLIETAYRGGLRASPAGLVAVNQRSVRAIATALLGELDQAGPAMLRWADDVYRQVAGQVLPLAVTGAATRREVTARMLDRFAAAGVTGFTDRSGSRWRIESYAEMAARTGLQRAHLAGTLDRITGQGADLVVVTTSPAGCPICRPYEAKMFSISGTHPDHPPLQTAIGGGLFHPNCTHTVNRFVEGLTEPVDAEELRVPNAPDEYERRQRTRELERRVDESRRRVAAAQQLGRTNVLTQQERLLAQRLEALRRHRAGKVPPASGRPRRDLTVLSGQIERVSKLADAFGLGDWQFSADRATRAQMLWTEWDWGAVRTVMKNRAAGRPDLDGLTPDRGWKMQYARRPGSDDLIYGEKQLAADLSAAADYFTDALSNATRMPTLYRGMRVSDAKNLFKVGDTPDKTLTSWSSDRGQAEKYARSDVHGGSTGDQPVLMIVRNAKGVKLDSQMISDKFPDHQEHVVGGRLVVRSVNQEDDVTVVEVEYVDD